MQSFIGLHCDFARQGSVAGLGRVKDSPKKRKLRLVLLGLCSILWMGVLVGRLYYLQLSSSARWQQSAMRQHAGVIKLAPERGPITDRSGRALAVSVPAGSIYIRPKQVKDRAAVIQALTTHLSLTEQQIVNKLDSSAPFVWVERQVPRVLADQIAELNLAGVGQMYESKRYYPYNEAAATLIGRVGVDGSGLSGLEQKYESILQAELKKSPVVRDGFGNRIHSDSDAGVVQIPRGNELRLTLDADLQQITEEELENGRIAANAKGAMAIMIDSDTGEILSLSQAPGINFNDSQIANADQMKNRIAEMVFEPGSILKPIVMAAAIEQGVVGLGENIDCEKGSYRVGRHIINDVHPSSILPVSQVVVRSSNIGMTKVGQRMGKERLYEALHQFGFGQSPQLGLPGESAGILRHHSKWANVDVATHSFGQGVAVNPLQVVRAIAAIANGGRLPRLRLVADGSPIESTQILSASTAASVQEMMYGVVEDEHGTGRRASIEGVRVGGKTGTAQRPNSDGRGYAQGEYISSFVGFADASQIGIRQRMTLMVVVDRPNTTSIYGGTLAGPVFQRIMQRSLYLLGTRNSVSPRFSSQFEKSNMLRPVNYRG